MRILVTGAAGFIGSGIAARLARDHDVIGLDLNPGPYVYLVGDCHKVAEWRQQVGSIDAIVHVAALHVPHVGKRSDEDFRRVNVEATSRLLDFAANVGANRFVLTSTTSLYGHALDPVHRAVWVDEIVEPQPRDIYDETKLEAESIVASAGGSMTCTMLRMSRCFSEPAELMAWYRLYRGVDRRDVADAHALAVTRKGPSATYVISAASPFKREDSEELLRDAATVIEKRRPGLVKRAAARGWEAPRSIGRVYDCGRAVRELGYTPRYGVEACLTGDWEPLPSD